jgi:DNA-binding beta-propeller fold protein YncE
MTELDALARIDGRTLEVSSLEAGDRPEIVVTIPDTEGAVVLDPTNATATIVRAPGGGDTTVTVGTLPALNQAAIDPTGRFAVAWFDLDVAIARAGGLVYVSHLGSYQDVTVIDLAEGRERSVDLTVGFRPRRVVFDAAGARAYAITSDGVSVIDLAQVTEQRPSIVPPISVSPEPLDNPADTDVDVTPDGTLAVARDAGEPEVRIVRLTGPAAGEILRVPLPSAPSDVDLAPDGARAYAVLRESSRLAVIDVPGDGIDPGGVELVDLEGELPGSLVLSADGQRGLLFTNASLVERIAVVSLTGPTIDVSVHPLHKAVRTAAFAPGGGDAVILHARAPGDPDQATTLDEIIDRSHGYSTFDLDTGFAKLQITSAAVGSFAFAPDASQAFLLVDGGDAEGAETSVHAVDLITGVVRTRRLGSPPEAIGVLPDADMVFVSQRHPLGRVTFIDLATGDQQTITGFDLNSRIVD